ERRSGRRLPGHTVHARSVSARTVVRFAERRRGSAGERRLPGGIRPPQGRTGGGMVKRVIWSSGHLVSGHWLPAHLVFDHYDHLIGGHVEMTKGANGQMTRWPDGQMTRFTDRDERRADQS